MRAQLLSIAALVSACGGGSGASDDDGRMDAMVDPPGVPPMITAFNPSPSQVPANTPTPVTWNWSYAVEPTFPDPVCSIDNGVGPVTRGQATTIRLTAVTTFTLTCTNTAGEARRQVVVGIPQAAPTIATFTATPSTLSVGVATDVTWTWTYTNTPSPAPMCIIEGIGPVTPGAMSNLTLTQARTFRLRCTNSAPGGTLTVPALTTVGVNECAAGTHDCQSNATCVDTPESFTCQCNAGYTGDGDTCSAQVACGVTPSLCDLNATCVGGTACVCKPGYFGSGTNTNCQRQRVAFVTSTTGNGDLSTWTGAAPNTGLAAADAVCQARAAAAMLPGTYVAWMSDATSDAYCRVHGLTGKKAANCGQAALPVAAGPWVRPDGQPFAPAIDRLLAPTRATYRTASMSELLAEVAVGDTDRVYTGTDDTGVLTSAACNNWTTSLSTVRGAMGEVNGGGTSWTDALTLDPTCNTFGRLRCVETMSGPALPSRHPVAKKAFLTSVTGTGNLSTWADAGGLAGTVAADAVCQARARFAGYANSQSFKALLLNTLSATSRITTNGPWARPDGVTIATSRTELLDGRLSAPLYLTETNAYLTGTSDTGAVWTGSNAVGSATFVYCSQWTTTSLTGTSGRFDLADGRWLSAIQSSCVELQRLYCIED